MEASVNTKQRRTAAHVRIEEHLRHLIADGGGRNAPLPTEQQLAEAFGVSRMTARQAYQRLAGSGVIVRYPSRGSFVAPKIVEDLTEWGRAGFTDRWAEQGYRVELRILAHTLRPAGAGLAEEFRVDERSPLTYLERLRLVDGLPLTLDRIFMPAAAFDIFTPEELARSPLVALGPSRGLAVTQAEMEISARSADPAEAAPLGIRAGDAVIVRETRDTADGGELLILELSVYPAGRVTYRMRVRLGLAGGG